MATSMGVFDNLLVHQEQDRMELMATAKVTDAEWTPSLTKLADRVMTHYGNYYRVESEFIKENVRVLLLLSPEWPTHYLEDSFLWVGGWRPSMTFHLLDFKPGLQLGAGFGELLKGVSMSDFKDISPSQLVRVGELQRQTIREETELTQSLNDSVTPDGKNTEFNSVDEIFGKADNLRLKTLQNLVHILNPIQAVQLFIPAAQLHLKVHEWGKIKGTTHARKAQSHGSRDGSGVGGLGEAFVRFFERWLHEQERDLEELKLAAKAANNESTRNIRQLVEKVMRSYENYYRVKSESINKNVLHMLTPAWRSLIEHAFFWIGGWRPTTSFHLLYSLVGLQLEAQLSDLLEGLGTNDLGDFSMSQLGLLNELQMETIREERALTETLAALQETMADSTMVKLSHIASELMRERPELGTSEEQVGAELVSERVELTLGSKEEKLKEIFRKADDLRVRTLRKVVGMLNPIQAVQYLIAAAELHLRVHDWGKHKDARASAAQQL